MDRKKATQAGAHFRILQRGTVDGSTTDYPVPAPEDVLIRKYIKLVQDYGMEHNTRSYTARNLINRLKRAQVDNPNVDLKELRGCFETGNYHVVLGIRVLHSLHQEFSYLRQVLTDIIDKDGYRLLQTIID